MCCWRRPASGVTGPNRPTGRCNWPASSTGSAGRSSWTGRSGTGPTRCSSSPPRTTSPGRRTSPTRHHDYLDYLARSAVFTLADVARPTPAFLVAPGQPPIELTLQPDGTVARGPGSGPGRWGCDPAGILVLNLDRTQYRIVGNRKGLHAGRRVAHGSTVGEPVLLGIWSETTTGTGVRLTGTSISCFTQLIRDEYLERAVFVGYRAAGRDVRPRPPDRHRRSSRTRTSSPTDRANARSGCPARRRSTAARTPMPTGGSGSYGRSRSSGGQHQPARHVLERRPAGQQPAAVRRADPAARPAPSGREPPGDPIRRASAAAPARPPSRGSAPPGPGATLRPRSAAGARFPRPPRAAGAQSGSASGGATGRARAVRRMHARPPDSAATRVPRTARRRAAPTRHPAPRPPRHSPGHRAGARHRPGMPRARSAAAQSARRCRAPSTLELRSATA